MTFAKKFNDGQGRVFTVSEVVQTPAGLTVYYVNEDSGEQYSCLIDAFTQRFKEVAP